MDNYELIKLKAQRAILNDLMREYSGRTLNNIITNLDARIKFFEKNWKSSCQLKKNEKNLNYENHQTRKEKSDCKAIDLLQV